MTDGERPEWQFSSATVRRTTNGALVVADGSAFSIRVLDRDGRFLHAIARRGEGPGELNGLFRMGLVHDTIFAIGQPPMASPVIQLYTDATFIRRTRPAANDSPVLQAIDRLGTGDWLVEESRGFRILDTPSPVGMLVPDSTRLAIWHESTGDSTGFVSKLPVVTRQWFCAYPWVNGPISSALTAYPFAGAVLTVVSDTIVWFIHAQDGTIERFDSRARPIDSLQLSISPAPFDDAQWEARRARSLDGARLARDSARVTAIFNPSLRPAFQPLAVRAISGIDGEVWIERFSLSEMGPREFIILSRTGHPVGTLAIPRWFDLQQVGINFLLGIRKDDDGIESVVELSLNRTP